MIVMKYSVTTLLAAFLITVFSTDIATAQFEGEIDFVVQYPTSSQQQDSRLNMAFTKDRIFIESNNSMDVMTGLSTNRILVRNDHQDFVLTTGPNEALKISKSDLDGLMNLIERVQGQPVKESKGSFKWDEKVTETGNTRSIAGYTVSEFVLKGDREGEDISVWLTDEIKVDWGLLNEAWHTTGTKQVGDDIPIELVMNRNSFPLLIEVHRNEQVVLRVESERVHRGRTDPSKMELASDVKLLGFTDVMMNMFRQRR